MGHRYRVIFDVCEEDGGNVTISMLQEMTQAAVSAAKLTLPPEKAKKVKVVVPNNLGGVVFHSHTKVCSGCVAMASDSFSEDVSALFPAKPDMTIQSVPVEPF